jgi:CRP/FNR family transcriptional regulator
LIEIKAIGRVPADCLARWETFLEATVSATSGLKTASQAKPTSGTACAACTAIGVPCALESEATAIRTRQGQVLTLGSDGGETAFIVRSGLLVFQLGLPGGTRQITGIFFPGDLLRSRFAPPHAEAAFVALSPGEVWRLRASALDGLAASEPAVRRYVDGAVASRVARQAIHAMTLGQFNCEQRVATLLLELALRTGASAPGGGVMFDLPFNRKDIADYLGLNPDTLSRIMSRFRTEGLIAQPERGRALVRDLAALAAHSPAAGPLTAMSGERRQDAPSGAAL